MSEVNSKSIHISNEEELRGAVKEVLQFAEGRKKFTLTGDLGAGKTTFTQYFCKMLGMGDAVTSPTFSLVNEYEFEDETGSQHLFHHIDLYRLNDIEEALNIGIEDYLYDDNYCFIEWPELIAPLLPEDVVHIKITIMPDLGRKILLL